MILTNEEILNRVDAEVRRLQKGRTKKHTISVRRLLESSSSPELQSALEPIVRKYRRSVPSGRYPSLKQVRAMLAKPTDSNPDVMRVQQSELASKYVSRFEQLLADGAEINEYLRLLSEDKQVDASVLSAIVAEITGGTLKRVTKAGAKRSILMEYADRSVSGLARHAAKQAKPF